MERASDVVEAAVDKLGSAFKDFKDRHDDRVKQMEQRLDEMEVAGQRLKPANGGRTSEEHRAFMSFVRRGPDQMSEPKAALRVSDDTAGGYLAPDEFVKELLRELVEFSPIRAASRVMTTATGGVQLPRRTGSLTAAWVDENEEATATQPSYGMTTIAVKDSRAFVDVSQKLLEDSAFDLGAELAFDFAEEFGRLEGEGFLLGDGLKAPFGILREPTVATVASGAATVVTSDGLISLMYSLPEVYRKRGSWLLNGSTIAAVRKLKSGDGSYLWQDSLIAGQPETLLGRPIIEATDMPDQGAGLKPILFGDFATACRVVDRVGMSILRDPFTRAQSGMIRFHARRRVGFGVVKPDALKAMICAVS